MNLSISVDSEEVLHALAETEDDLDKVINYFALQLAHDAAEEGRPISSALGEDWDISVSGSSRVVTAPVWWAHFIARGTAAHGPKNAPFLTFSIGDDFIKAERVQGITANKFDERAISHTKSKVDDILRRVIGG